MYQLTNLLTCIGIFIATFSTGQSFSLEQIMGAPYCSDLISSTTADEIAWVANEKGVRNIWLAKAPDFEPIMITNYEKDDGQILSNLQFIPNEEAIIYVRGSAPNQRGELANPTSNPKGVERAIWKATIDEKEPIKRLAYGSNPVISPSGKQLLYSRGSQISILQLETKKSSSSTLFQARGRNGSYHFSPDETMVAFVSNRSTHNFIGIYHIARDRIQWIAPSVDRDSRPVWSPNGQQIAFIRSPGMKKGELRNLTGANPFSIWRADIATGTAKSIWDSPNNEAGGFAQYYPSEPLRWTTNNRILFYSEHEGWMHIYSMNPSGKELVDLTKGACEAEHSRLSPNGTHLYYSSNCEDINRRHIWQIATTGGDAKLMTAGAGIETNPVVFSSGDRIAFRSASSSLPTGISVLKDGIRKAIFPLSFLANFPRGNIIEPQAITFNAADGTEIHGQLFEAPNTGDSKKPAVIFMHGGPIRQMLVGWHYSSYYANAYAMNQYLCAMGYTVLSVNFRSGIGYGQAFRRAENQGPRGASEYQDIVAAGQYLQALPTVNPEKIGLWGGSYGGYLTAMGLARNSDLFAAGVDLHGVHDWAWRGQDFSPGGAWGITEDLMKLAHESSPVHDLSKWTSPVLFVHGDDDRNVMFGQTVDLVQRLREIKVAHEILVLPDEVHGFYRYTSWMQTFEAAVAFFEKHLKSN